MKKIARNKGFTLIEILVVVAIIAVLAAIVIVAVNPAKRFREANNAQRLANINAISNAIGTNMVDNKGILTGCPTIPAAGSPDSIGTSATNINLLTCLDDYLAQMPVDPETGDAADTDYTIEQGSLSGSFKICTTQYKNDSGNVATPQQCVIR